MENINHQKNLLTFLKYKKLKFIIRKRIIDREKLNLRNLFNLNPKDYFSSICKLTKCTTEIPYTVCGKSGVLDNDTDIAKEFNYYFQSVFIKSSVFNKILSMYCMVLILYLTHTQVSNLSTSGSRSLLFFFIIIYSCPGQDLTHSVQYTPTSLSASC